MRIERSGFGLKMTSKLIEQAFEALNVATTIVEEFVLLEERLIK